MAKDNEKTQEEKSRVCPKDCTKCDFQQHAFCAAQMSFYLMEKIHRIEGEILDLKKEIESKSLNKSEFISPESNF